MKQLILSGGGDIDQAVQVDRFFFSLLPKTPNILYIPIAWKDGNYESCRLWFEKLITTHTVASYVMWTDLSYKTERDLQSIDAIYIGGGNTFYLLYLLRESGFADLLKTFVTSGKPVFGGSAGAIILGRDISTARFGVDSDENTVGLRDCSGLDEIHGHTLQCHYVPDQDAEIEAWVREHQLSVIGMAENSGIHVTDDHIQALGDEVFLFAPGQEKRRMTS